jgi:hypothetical protein
MISDEKSTSLEAAPDNLVHGSMPLRNQPCPRLGPAGGFEWTAVLRGGMRRSAQPRAGQRSYEELPANAAQGQPFLHQRINNVRVKFLSKRNASSGCLLPYMSDLNHKACVLLTRHLGRVLRTQSAGVIAEPLPWQIALHLLHLQRAEDERQLDRDG